jgi:hypothetical protein
MIWTSTGINGTAAYRFAHSCQLIGGRQMLSIGGAITNTLSDYKGKDTFPNSLGVFDLSALRWKDEYDPSAALYERPGIISEQYDKEENPTASVSWSDPALATLFQSATGSDSSGSSKKKSNTGAIAGGVVGGVAVIIGLLVLGAFLLMRKRNTQNQNVSQLKNLQIDGEEGKVFQSACSEAGGREMKTLLPELEADEMSHTHELDGTTINEMGHR